MFHNAQKTHLPNREHLLNDSNSGVQTTFKNVLILQPEITQGVPSITARDLDPLIVGDTPPPLTSSG
ncbi:hypothetical protein JTE90_027312 [Oedothorax gibbosus]|uniref:Uncharacterized protein n=1 Tax=Oedothorax gibbosus TaxID=931172 RepID=A0AAV6VYX8_9ARAC|nr:hypothetical protein JTE90_027312 [Oedothorax gibbosus]